MIDEKPRPEPAPEPAPRDDVVVSASRCPFCHEAVKEREWVACAACLARHHEGCWTESGRCATCRYETKLRPDETRRSLGPWIVAVFVLGFVMSGGIFAWGLIAQTAAVREDQEQQAALTAEKAERDRRIALARRIEPARWNLARTREAALHGIERRLPGARPDEAVWLRGADGAIRSIAAPAGREVAVEYPDDLWMLPEPGQPGSELIARTLRRHEQLAARGPLAANDRAYLGHLRLRSGDVAGALREAEAALNLDPTLPLPWAVRAEALLARGAAAGAIDDALIGQALSASGRPGWPRLVEAEATERLGDLEGAASMYLGLLEEGLAPPRFGLRDELHARVERLRTQLAR